MRAGPDFVLDFACVLNYNMQADNLTVRSLEQITWRSRVVGRARTIGNRVGVISSSRVRISPSPPYKNANIDTVSVNISVLILCPKSLYLRAFLHFRTCITVLEQHKKRTLPPSNFAVFHTLAERFVGGGAKSRRGCIFSFRGVQMVKKERSSLTAQPQSPCRF
jgi:hypothetical protein